MRRAVWSLIWCAALLAPCPAWAVEPTEHQPVAAELVAETLSLQPGRPVTVALRLRMAPGWHTYWENPGDAGMATTMRWTLPTGFRAGELQWPLPERIATPPLMSYGYTNEVWLLADIEVPSSLRLGERVTLAGHATWVACREICISQGADVQVTLPVLQGDAGVDARWQARFAQARARRPVNAADWTLRAALHDRSVWLRAVRPLGLLDVPVTDVFFLPQEPGVIEHAAAQPVEMVERGYQLDLPLSTHAAAPPQQLRGVLVAPEGWRGPGSPQALQVDVPVESHVAW